MYGDHSSQSTNFEMSTDKDFDLRVAEEYGKAQAIIETLQQLAEKVKEDPTKKSPKTQSTLTAMKLQLTGCSDGLSSLREDTDTLLEKCVLVVKDVANLDQAVKRLGGIRNKLEAEDITKADCTKWVEDLGVVKTSLEKRFQIKKVDSEKQASVSSLTEQLKQKDQQIDQLNKSLQERDLKLQEIQKHLEPPK